MTRLQLAFDISAATCHQLIRVLKPEYTEERIIQGLKEGSLVTTTWFDEESLSYIDDLESGEPVAVIEAQQIDGEYLDFR